jgi:CheY-like chemotaxis protein
MSKILVVDDSELNLQLAKIILVSAQHDVQVESQPLAALELAKHEHFDVIFSDAIMPVMSGVELVHALREQKLVDNTRVIALTGSEEEDELKELIKNGFDDYLLKPYESAELLKKASLT